jgi:hypothetical protein
MSQRFRRLTDLFVNGREVTLPDGSHLWIQAINAYERDECISDAQVARARLVLALKENGSERIKVEGRLAERGRDAMVVDLVQAQVDKKYSEIITQMESDPEWAEKLTIVRRTDFTQQATPATQDERDLVDKILTEWSSAIEERLDDERTWQTQHYARVPEETLLEDYLELWLDKRGNEVASAEYSLTEMWYATRYCEANHIDDDVLDHSLCKGHPDRVFATKADARSAPEKLQLIIGGELAALAMGDKDPKGSARPTSSSESSPTPSAAEESTPSTSTETLAPPPGTSPPPSATP